MDNTYMSRVRPAPSMPSRQSTPTGVVASSAVTAELTTRGAKSTLVTPYGAPASMDREAAIQTVAEWLAPQVAAAKRAARPPDIVEWAQRHYFIAETGMPIVLHAGQPVFARMFTDPTPLGVHVNTYLYSTIKKSGKTAFAGVCSRYTAEFSGDNAEVYFIANDKDQAKDRAYESAKISIEKTPGFDRSRRILPGRWRIIEKGATHIPTDSKFQAIAGEYEGAAGGNPTGTFWTELWAFTTERMKRLYDELTPVPTRERSFRFVETYAGFIDESELLYGLYKTGVKYARRLTKKELEPYAAGKDPWPFDDPPPFYINEAAGTLAFWDEGEAAQHRMPWQITERGQAYYREQEATLREEAYQRFHLNKWVSSAQSFINPMWWAACKGPLPAPLETLPKDWPVVVAVDGSVNSDCTAAIGVAREPVLGTEGSNKGKWIPSDTDVRIVFAQVWEPPKGGVIDLDDVEAFVRHVTGNHASIVEKWGDRGKDYADRWASHPVHNVVHLTYDAYQLHQMMTTLLNDYVVWAKAFSQASEREIADKQLYDLILRKQIHHNDEFSPEFMSNAAAYVAGEAAKNQDRLRIVKKAPEAKVDPVVATSMASRMCLWLLLS